MKKKETIVNIAILLVVILIIIVVKVKFFNNENPNLAQITDIEKITIYDLKGNPIKIADVLSKENQTYVYLFSVDDCHICDLKGHEQLKSYTKAGKLAFGIAVSDDIKDIALWAANYESATFYVLKKPDFYQYVKIKFLPAMLTIKDGEVIETRQIQP